MNLSVVYDAQQGKEINMAPKLASHLCTSYPGRFTFANSSEAIANQNYIEMEKNIMPHALPPESTKLDDGSYVVTTIESKITNGKYGEQEEITCITSDGKTCRIWVSLMSRKAIDQAVRAGIAKMNADGS